MKNILILLLVAVIFSTSGYFGSNYLNQVTPAKLTACQSDEYINIVAQVAMFRVLGASKDQV